MSRPAASTSAGPVPARSAARCPCARSCSEQGSATAPSRHAPSIAKTHSGRAPISVITTSPRPDAGAAPARPRPRRRVPRDLARTCRSARSRRPRSRAAPRRAGRSRARRSTHVAREVEAGRCIARGCYAAADRTRLRGLGRQLRSTREGLEDASESACDCCVGDSRCRCLALPGTASAGRLVATGHDADSHCSGVDGAGQCHFVQAAVSYVRGGAPVPSRPLLRARLLVRAATSRRRSRTPARPAGRTRWSARPRTSPRSTRLPLTTATFSAIVVGSSIDALSLTDTAAINARKADIATFFNQGGGILAFAGDVERRRPGRSLLPVRADRDRRQGRSPLRSG